VSVKLVHWYGEDVTVADVRAALDGVSLDTEGPGALNLSDGLRGLLYRLGASANQSDLSPDVRLAWVVPDGSSQ
jgi:hypothetical protein